MGQAARLSSPSKLGRSFNLTTIAIDRPNMTARNYTLNELMVCAAAREIRDNEVVFVGMRLPLIAFVVAKKAHAPNAIGLFENGVIRSTPASELIYTMADPPNILGATQCLDMLGMYDQLVSAAADEHLHPKRRFLRQFVASMRLKIMNGAYQRIAAPER